MKKEVKEFCEKHGITEDQFTGKEKISGSLDLRSLTSIPEGFNPTVGGSLDLRSLTSIPEGFNPTVGDYLDLSSLTSIPEGFNPTVGGSLYLRSGRKKIGSQVKPIQINRNFFWKKDGKEFAKIDGVFCEILKSRKNKINNEYFITYTAKKINKPDTYFIVNKGLFFAHGTDIKKAFEDLEFKIVSEKLKNEPIKEDTILTIKYYRLLTGACEFGVNEWMKSNNINEGILAKDILPLLEKTNAYGLEKFKRLITF